MSITPEEWALIRAALANYRTLLVTYTVPYGLAEHKPADVDKLLGVIPNVA